MTTLMDQLERATREEQLTNEIANAIKDFCKQKTVFESLKKALRYKFSAKIKYERYDNDGNVELKATESTQYSSYDTYLFCIEATPNRTALKAKIIFDGNSLSVLIIERDPQIFTNPKEDIIELLKQIIGLNN